MSEHAALMGPAGLNLRGIKGGSAPACTIYRALKGGWDSEVKCLFNMAVEPTRVWARPHHPQPSGAGVGGIIKVWRHHSWQPVVTATHKLT